MIARKRTATIIQENAKQSVPAHSQEVRALGRAASAIQLHSTFPADCTSREVQ